MLLARSLRKRVPVSSIIARLTAALALTLLLACEDSAPSRQDAARVVTEYETSLQGGRYFFDIDTGSTPAICGACQEVAVQCPAIAKLVQLGWLELRCVDGKAVTALSQEGLRATQGAERVEGQGGTVYRLHAANWELVAVDEVSERRGTARVKYRYRWKPTAAGGRLAGAGLLGKNPERDRQEEHTLHKDGGRWKVRPPQSPDGGS